MPRPTDPAGEPKQLLSEQAHTQLRAAIMRGDHAPGEALKPQELATRHGVSLAVMREALVRLVGEGLADRLPNRGFAVPAFSDRRWQDTAEARQSLEPVVLRMAVERGDLDWEARVRAAHHRLTRTPIFAADEGPHFSDAWSEAHHAFHRTLLEGCENPVLLDTFDHLWTAGELARRWSGQHTPHRDAIGEHRRLEEAVLARDADLASRLLVRHLAATVAVLSAEPPNDPPVR